MPIYSVCESGACPYIVCESGACPYMVCESGARPYMVCESGACPYIVCVSLVHAQCSECMGIYVCMYVCMLCMCIYMCMCVCSGSPPAVQLSGLSEGRYTLKMTPVGCASGSKTLSLTFTT